MSDGPSWILQRKLGHFIGDLSSVPLLGPAPIGHRHTTADGVSLAWWGLEINGLIERLLAVPRSEVLFYLYF